MYRKMTSKQIKRWPAEITRKLHREYPDATIALDFSNPLELLVATILSAQSTDRQINKITPDLFRKYRTARDYARADREEFERDIRSSGFFRNKAKNIIAAARKIEAEFGGKVPATMEELITLPGVARKTANIVLYHGFGKTEGIAVDTHVKRLAQRLGLSDEKDPVKIERDLMKLLPRELWGSLNDLLITHGRKICRSRKPLCGNCVLKNGCPAAASFVVH